MKRTSLGILIAAMSCGAAATFMSCDSSSSNPGAPPSSRDNGKGVRTLNDNCLSVFTGIENCSIGNGSLQSEGSSITVTGLGGIGDGVSGSFEDAEAWSQDISVNFGAAGNEGSLRYSASSDGQILGRLDIARQGDGSFAATALYSGEEGGPSAYSVHVFNNGALVGGQNGIPGSGGGPTIFNGIIAHAGFGSVSNDGPYYPIPYDPAPDDPNPWEEGACEWTLESASGLSVTLPNGTVLTGDKIAFTEQVTPGHTVYSHFQRVDVEGQMSSYTILGESSLAAN